MEDDPIGSGSGSKRSGGLDSCQGSGFKPAYCGPARVKCFACDHRTNTDEFVAKKLKLYCIPTQEPQRRLWIEVLSRFDHQLNYFSWCFDIFSHFAVSLVLDPPREKLQSVLFSFPAGLKWIAPFQSLSSFPILLKKIQKPFQDLL